MTGSVLGGGGSDGQAPLRVVVLGGDVADDDGALARMHGIETTGAVLVRPDGHVAWRLPVGATAETVTGVVAELLGTPAEP